MIGIFSLGFASCLANKYCSIPGFANPGNLIMKTNGSWVLGLSLKELCSSRPRLLNLTILTLLCLSDGLELGNCGKWNLMQSDCSVANWSFNEALSGKSSVTQEGVTFMVLYLLSWVWNTLSPHKEWRADQKNAPRVRRCSRARQWELTAWAMAAHGHLCTQIKAAFQHIPSGKPQLPTETATVHKHWCYFLLELPQEK